MLLDQLCRTFKDAHGHPVHAVHDVSLEVADGEFVVLVGPSGCGKSTTLRMIAGLEQATSGTIHIGERRVDGLEPKDRDVAMVFQNYALYPHMTVRENMAFGLRLRGTPRAEIEQRIKETARFLGLSDLLHRLPRALSGGQRQRVAVGRAIVRQPRAFLFDEPLSNLDAQMRVQTRMELARLHRELQATMLYVTHDQVEAMTLGNRIVVMNEGRVQQVAPPLTVYHQPVNRFVAGFIGSPPMNFLEGRLAPSPGGRHFRTHSIDWPLPDDATPGPAAGADAVLLGIRPEDLVATPDLSHPAPPCSLPGTVDLVERLGSENWVHARCPPGPLIARLHPAVTTPIAPGSPIRLATRPARFHWFDLQSGNRL